MKYAGKITRVQHRGDGVTLIVETEIGLRGVELDTDLWSEIMADTGIARAEALVGWAVEYDPDSGDLELITPDEDDTEPI